MRYFFLCFGLIIYSQNKFSINTESALYNIQFEVEKCKDFECNGKAIVQLISKKTKKFFQKFQSEDLIINLDSSNVKNLDFYSEHIPFIFKDYNFDGIEDFVIRNGNHCMNEGASYDVYLYNKSKKKFIFSDDLTSLVYDSTGLFEVNENEKKLIVKKKKGCCWSQTNEYKNDISKGLIHVRTFIEDGNIGDNKIEVIDRKLINGKWTEKKQVFKLEEYYAD